MTKKAVVEEFMKDYAEGDDLISQLLTARMNHDVTKEALATCELERFVLGVLQDIMVLMDYFADEQSYEEIAKTLCDAISGTPSGCEGCPLSDNEEYDEEGNAVCSLLMAENTEKLAMPREGHKEIAWQEGYAIGCAAMREEVKTLLEANQRVVEEYGALLSDVQSYQGDICCYCKNLVRDNEKRKVYCKCFGEEFLEEEGTPLSCGRFAWRGVTNET